MTNQRDHLTELRAKQDRQLHTIRATSPDSPPQTKAPGPKTATELQLRLVADDILSAHETMLDELELQVAQVAARQAAGSLPHDRAWGTTASSYLLKNLPHVHDDLPKEDASAKTKAIISAAALIELADLLRSAAKP